MIGGPLANYEQEKADLWPDSGLDSERYWSGTRGRRRVHPT